MASNLDRLVDDILIQIFQALPVCAVLSLRKVSSNLVEVKPNELKEDKTSRRYYLLGKLRCVWYARFCAEVLARNLPQPGSARPLSLLSAVELEQRTLRALHLQQAWPRLSAHMLVSGNYQHGGSAGRVDQVVFVPGGMEILTVQGDKIVHWLVVGSPRFAQGLKRVGECTPFEGVPCRIIKDGDAPGVIAVGPRESFGFQPFVKVFSASLKAPFVTLCDYARVPGIVVGIWRHLLLLDTTRELGGGGLELLDWHAQTTGTAILPRIPDLFGKYLEFVVFADHFLVVWEYCVSVFHIPDVPADGHVVVEHKRVFMLQEAISRPVGFTTCVARPLISDAYLDQDADWNMDMEWNGRHKPYSSLALRMPPTLTIVARSRRHVDSLSMVMLIPLVDNEGRERAATDYTSTFLYRLAYLPSHSAATSRQPISQGAENGEKGIGFRDGFVRHACTTLRLGWSGRGVFVVGGELRLVGPGLHILPPYEMQFGPLFETGEALYRMEEQRQRHSSWLRLDANMEGDAGEWDASGDKVDFDEGMGRFVVASKCGGFEVVQLD